MNLLDASVVLRARTVPAVLDLALRFCAAHRGLYRRLAACTLLPCLAGCIALRYAFGLSWLWTWVAAITLAGLAQGFFTAAAGQLLFEPEVRARDVCRRYLVRLPVHAFSLLLTRILIALGSLVIILGVGVWVRVLFVHEIVLLEGAGPGEAISRSFRFIRRQGSPAFALLTFLVTFHLAAVGGAELIGHALIQDVLQLGRPLGSMWQGGSFQGGSVYALIGFFAAVPFLGTARFLQYIDIRTRKEGWDIQLKFMAIAAADAEANRTRAA